MSWSTLLAKGAATKKSIHIATWWFEPGFNIQRSKTNVIKIAKLLESKAKEGVQIRLLLWETLLKSPARVFTILYNGYCGNEDLKLEFSYDIAWLLSASAGKIKNINVVGDDYDVASSSKIESLVFSHHQRPRGGRCQVKQVTGVTMMWNVVVQEFEFLV